MKILQNIYSVSPYCISVVTKTAQSSCFMDAELVTLSSHKTYLLWKSHNLLKTSKFMYQTWEKNYYYSKLKKSLWIWPIYQNCHWDNFLIWAYNERCVLESPGFTLAKRLQKRQHYSANTYKESLTIIEEHPGRLGKKLLHWDSFYGKGLQNSFPLLGQLKKEFGRKDRNLHLFPVPLSLSSTHHCPSPLWHIQWGLLLSFYQWTIYEILRDTEKTHVMWCVPRKKVPGQCMTPVLHRNWRGGWTELSVTWEQALGDGR